VNYPSLSKIPQYVPMKGFVDLHVKPMSTISGLFKTKSNNTDQQAQVAYTGAM